MPSVFLIQLAAGCMAITACSRVREVAWRWLRLMAVVSCGLLMLATMLLWAEAGWHWSAGAGTGGLFLVAGLLFAWGWLVTNALQGERVQSLQRLWPALGAAFGLAAATIMALHLDARPVTAGAPRLTGAAQFGTTLASLALGAGLLGSATAAMLLGHRYLTDTGMTIAPLRRLAGIFAGAVVVRSVWALVALGLNWSWLTAQPGDQTWLWLMLATRFGVGLLGTGLFAYMVWDCVRRRSTQSATGILYPAMVFSFLGELVALYFLRTSDLPI